MAKENQNISFETALQELERVTERLKEGNVSLEESLKLYDEGIKYYGICANILEKADQKIMTYNKELNSFKEAE